MADMIDRLLKKWAKEKMQDYAIYEYVNSDALDRVEYEPNSETLVLYFMDGSMYSYYGVPVDIAAELVHADSHGEFFNDEIRNDYSYTKLI
jgi:hypothetical protein